MPTLDDLSLEQRHALKSAANTLAREFEANVKAARFVDRR